MEKMNAGNKLGIWYLDFCDLNKNIMKKYINSKVITTTD